MTDAERVLELLIHDVRTPVGVAQGYVRLLQEHRLEAAADRERALASTMDALGRIARLCENASGFVNAPAAGEAATIAAARLAAAVDARIRRLHFHVGKVAIDPEARVRVAGDPERLADAISVVLATSAPKDGHVMPSLDMDTHDATLRLVADPQGPAAEPHGDGRIEPFDPWTSRELAVPLACRTIDRASGRVSKVRSAVVVTIPIEAHTR